MEHPSTNCPACGSEIESGTSACPSCGAAVPAKPAADAVPTQEARPRAFLSWQRFTGQGETSPQETKWRQWLAISSIVLLVGASAAVWSGGFRAGRKSVLAQ